MTGDSKWPYYLMPVKRLIHLEVELYHGICRALPETTQFRRCVSLICLIFCHQKQGQSDIGVMV